MLLENGYDRALVYRARITVAGRTRPTDVCVVLPSNRSSEHWPEAIERIDLSDFELVTWRGARRRPANDAAGKRDLEFFFVPTTSRECELDFPCVEDCEGRVSSPLQILRNTFGFQDFRGVQEQVIGRVMAGRAHASR